VLAAHWLLLLIWQSKKWRRRFTELATTVDIFFKGCSIAVKVVLLVAIRLMPLIHVQTESSFTHNVFGTAPIERNDTRYRAKEQCCGEHTKLRVVHTYKVLWLSF